MSFGIKFKIICDTCKTRELHTRALSIEEANSKANSLGWVKVKVGKVTIHSCPKCAYHGKDVRDCLQD